VGEKIAIIKKKYKIKTGKCGFFDWQIDEEGFPVSENPKIGFNKVGNDIIIIQRQCFNWAIGVETADNYMENYTVQVYLKDHEVVQIKKIKKHIEKKQEEQCRMELDQKDSGYGQKIEGMGGRNVKRATAFLRFPTHNPYMPSAQIRVIMMFRNQVAWTNVRRNRILDELHPPPMCQL
jgi:hypothetical protein